MPSLWHSASFQLTFGCLFGILYVPRAVERFRPQRGELVDGVWTYFWTSFGAVLGTLPTTAILFGEINFTSVTTNWFAVPPVSFVIMPLGLMEMFLCIPGLPKTASWLATANAWAAMALYHLLVWWMGVVPSLRLN